LVVIHADRVRLAGGHLEGAVTRSE
jgi:hypothetical protein